MIRPLGLFDIPAMGKLQRQGLPLDPKRALTRPESPLAAALRAPLSLQRSACHTHIAYADQEASLPAGFVQLRCRKHHRSVADVTYIAPALTVGAGTGPLWTTMLDAIAWEAGSSGVQRIFASLPADSDDAIPFLNAGFVIFAVEELFVLAPARTSPDAPSQQAQPQTQPASRLTLRPQTVTDAWALQRLYSAIVPLGVRQVEGLSETRSAQSEASAWVARSDSESYVLDRQGDVVGHMEVLRGRIGHWAHFVLHPGAVDRADDFVLAGLQLLSEQAPLPVYTHVRSYERGVHPALVSRGFQILERREMAVRQTIARVHEPVAVGMRVLEPRDAVSATPTLVHSARTDGTDG